MSKRTPLKSAIINDSATCIPDNAGISVVSSRHSSFLLRLYTTLAAFALASFVFDWHPRVQYFGLAALFPGGGWVGIGGWWILAFVLNLVFFAASLFLWFATANIILPFLAWPGQALLFPILPITHRAGYSVVFVPAMAAVAAWFIFRFLQRESATASQRRRQRNSYLPSVIKDLTSTVAQQKPSTELEIQPEELSQLRHILKIAMQDQDDWSNFTVIDQFQTASIRYKLCEMVYVLALANKIYTPSFRGGYLQQAQKKVIYKYCQKKVLNYWKWECLWGKLSTDYEPVKKDNIMLTAFLLLAISLYESATGDHAFSEENALELVIDNAHRYRHSATTLAQALVENFSASSYCLYACEPNWMYTFCNLNGINSLLAHDANTGRRDVELVLSSFHKGLVEEFLDESGSAHAIRSSPTGLRLPNIVGAANEFSVSCLTGPNFPDLSLRCYAIARHEFMEFDSQRKLSFKNIQRGDMLDPGNYGSSMALLYASSLMAAHEHGDIEVARQINIMIDNDQSLLRTEKDGCVWYEGASLFMKCQLLRARLWLRSGWSRFMQPSSDAVQHGPYLTDVNFEEAMVAKAVSHTGDDLDLVLYPNIGVTSTWISIKNLKPSSGYIIKDGIRFTSNEQGIARISIQLDGRTAIHIILAL